MSNVEALWAPPPGGATAFPCVDCGLMTGNFCDGGISVDFDHCFAAERVPKDYANFGGVGMQCSRQVHWSGVPEHLSRTFTNERAKQAVAAEWFARNFLRQQQRYEAIGRSRLKALT